MIHSPLQVSLLTNCLDQLKPQTAPFHVFWSTLCILSHVMLCYVPWGLRRPRWHRISIRKPLISTLPIKRTRKIEKPHISIILRPFTWLPPSRQYEKLSCCDWTPLPQIPSGRTNRYSRLVWVLPYMRGLDAKWIISLVLYHLKGNTRK
jgi:hypothetical protein